MNRDVLISLVILTYNRPDALEAQLQILQHIQYEPFEVLVVDNCSDPPADSILARFPFAKGIRNTSNLGAVARNIGIRKASGDIVITLDDDVMGIDDSAIGHLIKQFEDPHLGALCFKVIDPQNKKVTNWCHHCKPEQYADQEFLTIEITEGAVAFRRDALAKSGLYPDSFFISHEGPDLAWRLVNAGYLVKFSPDIVVRHSHSPAGRTSWRRYYYDTRNLVWLALRNFPLVYGVRRTVIGLTAMFVYSLRDGYLRYWGKGIIDGIRGAPEAIRSRTPPSKNTRRLVKAIEANRPSFLYLAKKRLFSRTVRI